MTFAPSLPVPTRSVALPDSVRFSKFSASVKLAVLTTVSVPWSASSTSVSAASVSTP